MIVLERSRHRSFPPYTIREKLIFRYNRRELYLSVVSIVFIPSQKGDHYMSERSQIREENKSLLLCLFEEAIHLGNMSIVDEVFSADFVDRSSPDQSAGPQGVKAYFIAIRTGFPDIHVTMNDLIAEGDKVVVRSTWSGTHLGAYEGVAPTGRRATRTLIQIFRIVEGRIMEEWNEGGGLLDVIEANGM